VPANAVSFLPVLSSTLSDTVTAYAPSKYVVPEAVKMIDLPSLLTSPVTVVTFLFVSSGAATVTARFTLIASVSTVPADTFVNNCLAGIDLENVT